MTETKKLSGTSKQFVNQNEIENPTLMDVKNYVTKGFPNYSVGQIEAVSNHIFNSL